MNENGLKPKEQAKLDKIYAIIDLMKEGKKTKEIALILKCSERLVQIYKKEIKENNITKPKDNNIVILENIEFSRITDTELSLMIN